MNNEAINQRIQALESELAGLKAELNKPKKFEFKYEDNMCFIGKGSIKNVPNKTHKTVDYSSFNYRQFESNADADFQLQKELMCIGALAEQIDPYYKYKIRLDGDGKYAIIHKDSYYQVSSHSTVRYLGVVYMPKDVAKKVCEILNNKGVEL